MRKTAVAIVAASMATAVFGWADVADADSCNQDGVSLLCVSASPTMDVLTIRYQVTQQDGPGAYSIYDVDTVSGVASNPVAVGPIANQATVNGTLHAALTHCYNVYLASDAGPVDIAGPVCG